MKWSKTLRFSQPVRDLAIAPPPPAVDLQALVREHEEQAYARGVADGEQRLGAQLLQQRNELHELHQGALQALRDAVSQVTRDAENTLVDFAFEVAQKIVAEIPINRDLIEANIRSALAQGEEATEFFIHLHPDDLALLERHTSDLLAGSPSNRKMHFIPAPEVGRGGCLVRTKFGIIDARRETRLARLQESLV